MGLNYETLGLKWSRYVPHAPTAKQLAFLLLPHREAFFGGAAGGGKCLTPDHEVLVFNRGWIPIAEIRVGDLVASADSEGRGSWELVACTHSYAYEGKLRVSTEGPKFAATPNHKWRSRWESGNDSRVGTSRSAKWRWVDSSELRPGMKLMAVGTSYDTSLPYFASEDEAELFGWWLSEGSGFCNGRTRISQVKKPTRKQIVELCERLGLDYKVYEREIRPRWIPPESGTDCYDKYIPKNILFSGSGKAILRGLLGGDGYLRRAGWEYSSSSKQLAEDVQTLATLLGFRATIKLKPVQSGRPHWLVAAYPRTTWTLSKTGLGWTRYSGKVYCLTVPTTGQFLVRHQGRIHVTGNSDALLMAALQYVDVPGYSALLLRKTLTDLEQPGALLDRLQQWLSGQPGVKYVASKHEFQFETVDHEGNPSIPSKIRFGYIGESNAFLRYQGIEIQFCAFDELTQHVEDDYRYLFSRLRKNACPIHKTGEGGEPIYEDDCPLCNRQKSLPIRMRSASNPGGPGHAWCKQRFRIGPSIPLKEASAKGLKFVPYVGKHPTRPFIPSFAKDNPHLNLSEYENMLDELDPTTREQLKHGQWDVSAHARFRRSWARYYSSRGEYVVLGKDARGPQHHVSTLRIFCVVDPAVTSKYGPGDTENWKKQASYTVISTWGITNDANLVLLDLARFRREAPEVVKTMKRFYLRWRPSHFTVEATGVGAPIAQTAAAQGLPINAIHPRVDKVANSAEAMLRMERGKVWFPETADWLETFEDEIFFWTGSPIETDDQIDVLSNACKEVMWEDPIVYGNPESDGSFSNVLPDQDVPQFIQAYPEILPDPYYRMGLGSMEGFGGYGGYGNFPDSY